MRHAKIAVVDFGGQYAHLIATKIRRLQVLAEIRQPEDRLDAYAGYRGIILSGSPALASQGDEGGYDPALLDLEVPILGFCFGHQEIAKHYGGRIEFTRREYGPARLCTSGESQVFAGLPAEHTVWMSHGDSVTELPGGFVEIGASVDSDGTRHPNAAIADEARRRYGFQFHPEVDDTEYGDQMLANFVLTVCGCEPTWTMERYVEEQIEAIRAQVGTQGVFLLASGGVDSTVCARLLGQALSPDQLHLLHIDNGLMRKNESRQVVAEFERWGFGKNLHHVDAAERFVGALGGEIEPEKKRKIIGELFIEVFREQAEQLDLGGMLLGQGTIYPDTIETGGTKRADVIKTHHNRVAIIEEMIAAGRVIEPLRELYKVEVRELGVALGVDESLVWRHPFPGPGLGVRLLGSDGRAPEGHDPAAAQPIIDEVAGAAGLSGALLPVRSVGVKADLRCYEQPVALWGETDHATLLDVAARLYQRVPGVNRCVFDLTGRGLARAVPVAAHTTRARLDLLREADDIVMRALSRYDLMREVWQCPTVLLPLRIADQGQELVILRPVLSERAMTAKPAPLPQALIDEIRAPLLALAGVSGLVLDVSTKPPGTIEWE
ncbi:MAG: glutamine-hydrolyzing GMP synthase [Deltaproteobacteria bacterium]|jgi:GMP synthase (glutamine-hydrolysing)|nr:glutamine-hydrolyzing GMP synthase [Deltaproteobacteria bacterium]MBW2533894.1 glutamine-hydrolyzing GMP synthase [Deltaproteobacteria bacterium]